MAAMVAVVALLLVMCRRSVQRRPGVRADLPVDQQMMPCLEPAHREIGSVVEQPICSDVQAPLHVGHPLALDAQPQDAVRVPPMVAVVALLRVMRG